MSNRPVLSQDDALVQLLRLKKHENPGEEYFDELLPRIHTKLRAEMMRKSSTMLLVERMGVFFDNLAGGRWVAGGLAAYAAALVGGLVLLQWSAAPDDSANTRFQPVSLQPGAPVQPQQISVPFQFKVVPVGPLGPDQAQGAKPGRTPASPAPGGK